MGGEQPEADDLNVRRREQQEPPRNEDQRLFESLRDGAVRFEVVLDDGGQPVDYRFFDVNPAYEKLLEAPRQARIGHLLSEFTRTNSPCFCLLAQVASSGQPGHKEMYVEDVRKYLRVSAFRSDTGVVTAVLSDVTDRQLAQNELHAAKERLVAELAGMTRLHAIATRFVREGDLTALLDEVIEEAIVLADADMGTIELRDPDGALKLAVQRGFDPALVSQSTVQVTPLASRSGKALGVLSIYFRLPRRVAPNHPKLFELLALQCADALERDHWAEERAALNARAEWAHKLRESEARFRTTVDNIPINLVLYDRDFRLLYMNPTLLAFCAPKLKIPKESLIGMSGGDLWPAEVWDPLRAYAERAIATRERQTYDLATGGTVGRPLLVRNWTVVPLFAADGQVDQILVMSQDTTAQRRLVDELREADRRKSEFIALLSHELRNPLAAIRTTLYVLEHGDPGSRAVADARVVIDRQVGHVVRMVDDLLDVTRITRSKIELQRRLLDLNQVVHETIEDNRPHLEFGGVRLDVRLSGAPVRVNADGARISQILTNLLSNAIKFSASGGTVTVMVTSDHVKRQAVLMVSDTGVGIDEATLDRLFQPFIQGDLAFDRSRSGLGLGLALVKGLVELHGGEVTARSAGRDQGATFTVCLPLNGTPAPAAKPGVARKVAQPARKVLIIDDDEDVAGGLRAALEIHDHHVEVAGDGPTGLSAARAFKPDIVFCDVGLPGMNGYEVARAFRADRGLRDTLLVALSGYAQAEDLKKARTAGFDHHLAKPPDMQSIARICSDPGGATARTSRRGRRPSRSAH